VKSSIGPERITRDGEGGSASEGGEGRFGGKKKSPHVFKVLSSRELNELRGTFMQMKKRSKKREGYGPLLALVGKRCVAGKSRGNQGEEKRCVSKYSSFTKE